MTREIRKRRDVKEVKEEITYTVTDVKDIEVDHPGIRCDFCDQWYADDEGVEFTRMVKNPRVKGKSDDPMTLPQLLDNIKAIEATNLHYFQEVGSGEKHLGGYEYVELPVERAFICELNNTIRNAGASYKGLKFGTHEYVTQFEASLMEQSRYEVAEGDIHFIIDMDLEVGGEELDMCEYCEESHD